MTPVPTARADTIDSSELGFTLMAEGIFMVDQEVNTNWPDLNFGTDEDARVQQAVDVLTLAHANGIGTLVDRTIPGIGRDVRRIKRVADRVPMNIIVTTGWYTWNDLPFYFLMREMRRDHFEEILGRPMPSLEDLLVRDLEEGIAGTGVRAGIIKAVTDRYGISDGVRMALNAAAGAHRRTGAPITTHTGIHSGAATGLLQQQVFREQGVDLTRVVLGHIDYTPGTELDEIQQCIDNGSYVGFDTLFLSSEMGNRESRVSRVVELCRRGHAGQLVLSHDGWVFHDLWPEEALRAQAEAAGSPLYTEVKLELIPELLEAGVSEDDVRQMTVENPRRIFETRDLGPY
jgi:phosphotriesterase-related protein